jgi:four helix bundle protein
MDQYRQLIAWQRGVSLVCTVYKLTQHFPKQELFGLTSQMRRCASSVPSNIAEGAGRRGVAEQRRFFLIARGSLWELDTQVEIAHRLEMLNASAFATLTEALLATSRPLAGLISRIDRLSGRP